MKQTPLPGILSTPLASGGTSQTGTLQEPQGGRERRWRDAGRKREVEDPRLTNEVGSSSAPSPTHPVSISGHHHISRVLSAAL